MSGCTIVDAMLRRTARAAAFAIALTSPAVTFAQETRTASLEKLRAEKAAALQPYQPGRIEKALLFVEREDPMRRIAPINGFFVTYGYTGKTVGSGIGAAVGYRHDLFDRRARAVVEAGATWRHYRMVRADFSVPSLAAGPARARNPGRRSSRAGRRLLWSRRRLARAQSGEFPVRSPRGAGPRGREAGRTPAGRRAALATSAQRSAPAAIRVSLRSKSGSPTPTHRGLGFSRISSSAISSR